VVVLEAISKIGFWVKIEAEPCFHAKPDDRFFIVQLWAF
jgi:hypothetical protein